MSIMTAFGALARQGATRMDADLCFSVPLFLVDEAAQYLGLPASTLRSWIGVKLDRRQWCTG